jgi:hypothetical protein
MDDKPPTGTPTPGESPEEKRDGFKEPQDSSKGKQTATAEEEQDEDASGTAAFVEKIGKLRDGLLVAGGLLYVLGYAVWSLNAWRQGLGILPALESQYLVAGIVPALIIYAAILIARLNRANKGRLKRSTQVEAKPVDAKLDLKSEVEKPGDAKLDVQSRLDRMVEELKRDPVAEAKRAKEEATGIVVTWLIAFGVLAAIVYYTLYKFGWLPESAKHPERWGGSAITVAAFVVVFLMNILPELLSPYMRTGEAKLLTRIGLSLTNGLNNRPKVKWVATALLSAVGVACIIAWGWYYPSLPQALGGFRPRCAQLDLARKDVSAATLAAVAPALPQPAAIPSPEAGAAEQKPPPEGVVRTDKVDVLFSGSDYMLIRASGKVYEIKKDVVHAIVIVACD